MFRFPPQHNQSQDSLNEHTPILSHKGTVEYFIPVANTGPRGDSHHSWRECSKLVLRLLEGKSVQQGRSHFDARSVHGVREHGKTARTPLAAFFNIPINDNPQERQEG